MPDLDEPDPLPALLEIVRALEADTRGLAANDRYEIRVDILRGLLFSWIEMREVGMISEPAYVDERDALDDAYLASLRPDTPSTR